MIIKVPKPSAAIICHSCNTKLIYQKEDVEYYKDYLGYIICPDCKNMLPISRKNI